MAGSYADAPGPRIAYDRDGSAGVIYTSAGALTSLTNPQVVTLNDEDGDGVIVSSGGGLAIIFPQLMTIMGWFTSRDTSNNVACSVSSNTTNGFDGTWTAFGASLGNGGNMKPGYRTLIRTATAVTGIKAIRFEGTGSNTYQTVHIYGKPDASSSRLEFWHPTLDQPLSDTPAYFDYGDMPRGTTATKDFRIKNLSGSLTASTITVGCEVATESASPTYASMTTLRYNGGSYGATASLASLAPNTISNVFTARLDLSASAVMSVWSQRYYASAATWA